MIKLNSFALLFVAIAVSLLVTACGFLSDRLISAPFGVSDGTEDLVSAQVLGGALPPCNPLLTPPHDKVFDTLYAIGFNSATDTVDLRIIDPKTAQNLARQTVTLPDEVLTNAHGLAINPLTGVFFAIVQVQGETGDRRLVTIDPFTGIATSVGNTGDRFADIAFDTCGRLFGVTGDAANFGSTTAESLFLISTTDATTTLIRKLGNGDDGEAIAINPFTGRLYHASGFFNHILEIVYLNSGETVNIPYSASDPLTVIEGVGEINALTFALGGTALYASNIFGYLLNISTQGFVEVVGIMDLFDKTQGLAFGPSSISTDNPEPIIVTVPI